MSTVETAIVAEPAGAEEPRGRRRRSVALIVGTSIVGTYILAAVLAPWLAPYDPLAQDVPNALAAPSGSHPLGTDHLGRDVLSRLLHGSRVDLLLGMAAAGAAGVLGTVLGLVAGYAGRSVDVVVTRVMDVVQALPGIVLLLVLLLVLGPGAGSIIAALALTGWVAYARLVRASVLVVRDQDFTSAARLAGLGHPRVLFRHVLPNVWIQGVIYMTSDIVIIIGAIAALGYLGIGIQAPTPEWGQMIYDGQAFLASHWWLSAAPGLAIVVLGLGLALVSDALTDRARR
ncbi:ABC transporter permease [Phytoactinopolyspora limicola]|uniref:ABC transporter permease n=1 Tax=Phytoactinopolyspora limicola TaxID=2715536 RepID=UPI001408DAC9|nr:ABC transporter permease [Phytoactinopolyspora limicola]